MKYSALYNITPGKKIRLLQDLQRTGPLGSHGCAINVHQSAIGSVQEKNSYPNSKWLFFDSSLSFVLVFDIHFIDFLCTALHCTHDASRNSWETWKGASTHTRTSLSSLVAAAYRTRFSIYETRIFLCSPKDRTTLDPLDTMISLTLDSLHYSSFLSLGCGSRCSIDPDLISTARIRILDI
jgi:hypothetical protein